MCSKAEISQNAKAEKNMLFFKEFKENYVDELWRTMGQQGMEMGGEKGKIMQNLACLLNGCLLFYLRLEDT